MIGTVERGDTVDRRPERGTKSVVARDLMDGLLLLSQFGMSIAISMGICLWGAAWLRDRYGMDKWIFIPAILLGLWLSFSSFRSISVYLQNRDAWKKKQERERLKKEAREREVRQIRKK